MAYRVVLALVLFAVSFGVDATAPEGKRFLISVKATNAEQRTQIADLGLAIERVMTDKVTVIGDLKEIDQLKKRGGFEFDVVPLPHAISNDFPAADSAFHNYAELQAEIDSVVKAYPDILQKISIGDSLEGRDLTGVRISSEPESDSLPTAVFMGCHHAREHLSVEVPLRMIRYLAENYARDERVKKLIDTREIYIVPMINPDGAEYDVATGRYKYWRKNRRDNGDGNMGVDLNRNYGKGWGGSGSSGSTWSDTYRGPKPFSEPETQAVRDFLKARDKTTVLISFHTFSELILWPWGHTNDVISNDADRKVFETMGKKMAEWNGYKPQKSSALYVASGDTTDWAYDELGIFAYTFELSPASMFSGGFYPGAKAIDPTFKANIEPMLYLIDKAENPYASDNSVSDPLGMLE